MKYATFHSFRRRQLLGAASTRSAPTSAMASTGRHRSIRRRNGASGDSKPFRGRHPSGRRALQIMSPAEFRYLYHDGHPFLEAPGVKTDIQGQSDALTSSCCSISSRANIVGGHFSPEARARRNTSSPVPRRTRNRFRRSPASPPTTSGKSPSASGGGVKFRLIDHMAAAGGISGLSHDVSQAADCSRPAQYGARNFRAIHSAIRHQLHLLIGLARWPESGA